jgi:predicted outer membrane lipoprotein
LQLLRHRRTVTSIVVGFILLLSLAFAVIVAVALPHVREGAPMLTDRGERVTGRVSRQAGRWGRVIGDTLTGLVAGVGGRSAEQHRNRNRQEPRSR